MFVVVTAVGHSTINMAVSLEEFFAFLFLSVHHLFNGFNNSLFYDHQLQELNDATKTKRLV